MPYPHIPGSGSIIGLCRNLVPKQIQPAVAVPVACAAGVDVAADNAVIPAHGFNDFAVTNIRADMINANAVVPENKVAGFKVFPLYLRTHGVQAA